MKKRRLFLLCLLPVVWAALFLNLQSPTLPILYLGNALAGLGLGTLAVRKLRNPGLRLLTLLPLLLPLGQALYVVLEERVFLWELEVFFLLVIALCYLLGWGAAWGFAPDGQRKEEAVPHET